MTAKRGLITDTYNVVKKVKKVGKRSNKPPPPPPIDEDLSQLSVKETDLQELMKFDLDWRFGPCTGISRLQRWERAALHGLNPPQEIKDIVLKERTDSDYIHSLWHDYPL